MMPCLQNLWRGELARRAVFVSLVLLLLAMAPFAAALEIHHQLAAADHDGHEHSDFDLCYWVQHHSSGSLILEGCDAGSLWQQRSNLIDLPSLLLTSDLLVSTSSPRAPPHS